MEIEQNIPPVKLKDKNGNELELVNKGTEETPQWVIPMSLEGTDTEVTIEADALAKDSTLKDGSQVTSVNNTAENPVNSKIVDSTGTEVDFSAISISDISKATKISGETDPAVSFQNNDAANTQKTITLTKPGTIKKYHLVVVHNPSTETDLTVKVRNKLAIGTVTTHTLGSYIIPAKSTVTGTNKETDMFIVSNLFLGDVDAELIISNNAALGDSGAFTVTVQVYAL